MARLDRLGTAKEIAQLGATIGREFSYELLHAVSSAGEVIGVASGDEPELGCGSSRVRRAEAQRTASRRSTTGSPRRFLIRRICKRPKAHAGRVIV